MTSFKLAVLAYFSRLWYTFISGVANVLFFLGFIGLYAIVDHFFK